MLSFTIECEVKFTEVGSWIKITRVHSGLLILFWGTWAKDTQFLLQSSSMRICIEENSKYSLLHTMLMKNAESMPQKDDVRF